MNKLTYKSDKLKKCLAVIIAVLMVVSFTPIKKAFAAENDKTYTYESFKEKNKPSWYTSNKDSDPYGFGVGTPFTMLENDELFLLKQKNAGEASYTSIYDTLNSTESNTNTKITDSFKNSGSEEKKVSVPDIVLHMDYTHAVSFDPNGTGRHDHVAVIGFVLEGTYNGNTYNKSVVVIAMDATSKTWSNPIEIGKMKWVNNGDNPVTDFCEAEPYLSIVAGDFDKDHKDTLVTFYGAYEDFHLQELQVTNAFGNISISEKNIEDMSHPLLNPEYTKNSKSIYDGIGSKKETGKGCIFASLAVGDVNADTVDDLVVISSCDIPDSSSGYNYKAFIPYMSVSYGADTNGNTDSYNIFNKNNVESKYVYDSDSDNVCLSVKRPTVVVAKTDDGLTRDSPKVSNSIVLLGFKLQCKYDATSKNLTSRNEFHDDYTRYFYGAYKYSFNKSNSTVDKLNNTEYYANTVGATNVLRQNQIEADYNIQNPPPLEAIHMNGKGNTVYFCMDGDIYQWNDSDTYPILLFDNSRLNDNDQYVGADLVHRNYIVRSGTAVGNFDGNDKGFEQIVYTIERKQNASHNHDVSLSTVIIGTKYSSHDPESGLISDLNNAFYCTERSKQDSYEWEDKNARPGKALALTMCAVDNDQDGLLAKYNECDYDYSDPSVEVVLQAGPYFDKLVNSSAQGKPLTEISFGKSVAISNTSGTTVSSGFSLGAFKTGSYYSWNITAGLSMDWAESFTTTDTVKLTTTYSTGCENDVVVSFIPLAEYYYDTYNVESGAWDPYGGMIGVEHAPIIDTYSISKYNKLVDEFNSDLKKKDPNVDASYLLTKIDGNFLSDNLGSPAMYPNGEGNTNADIASNNNLSGFKRFYADLETVGYGDEKKKRNAEISHSETDAERFSHGVNFKAGFTVGASPTEENKSSLRFALDGNITGLHNNTDATTNAKDLNLYWNVGKIDEEYDGKYNYQWGDAIWDSNIPLVKNNPDEKDRFAPVIGYITYNVIQPLTMACYNLTVTNEIANNPTDTQSDVNNSQQDTNGVAPKESKDIQQQDTATGWIVDKAYADTNNDKAFKIKWEVPDGAENVKYQVYTSINGVILPVGEPVTANEFVFYPSRAKETILNLAQEMDIDDLPIYQFSVAPIDKNGNEGARSGWVYYLSDNYFQDPLSCCLMRNCTNSDNRISLFVKDKENKVKTKNLDVLNFIKGAEAKHGASVSFLKHGLKKEQFNLNFKEDAKYGIESVEAVGYDYSDTLYEVKLQNKNDYQDTKSFVLRVNTGKSEEERALESEIINTWVNVDAVKNDINNENTRDTTKVKLKEIKDTLKRNSEIKITGNAEEIYETGLSTLNEIDKASNTPANNNWVWILILVLCICVVLGLVIFFVVRRKKKPTIKSNQGPELRNVYDFEEKILAKYNSCKSSDNGDYAHY